MLAEVSLLPGPLSLSRVRAEYGCMIKISSLQRDVFGRLPSGEQVDRITLR